MISLVNGERPEPRAEGDQPAETPEAALRRTIEFVGSTDGWQNHWYVYDRQTGVLHQFEQGDSGQVLLLGEDAATDPSELGELPQTDTRSAAGRPLARLTEKDDDAAPGGQQATIAVALRVGGGEANTRLPAWSS